MKFLFRELHDLIDAMRNFEQLETTADGPAATQALRSLGTKAGQALAGNQAAGGDLSGTYPNPTLSTQGLQKVLQLAGSGVTAAIAFGTATITFPNSNRATSITVTHSIGRNPASITFGVADLGVAGLTITPGWSVLTTSQFTLGASSSAVLNQTVQIGWQAIG